MSARGPREHVVAGTGDGWDVIGRMEEESFALAGLDLWIQTAPSATQSTAPHVADVLPRRDHAAYWQSVLDEDNLAELDKLADVVLRAGTDGPMATMTPRAPPAPEVGHELRRRQRQRGKEEEKAEKEKADEAKEPTPTPTPTPTPPASPLIQPTVPVVTVEQTKVDPQEAAKRRLRLARKRAKTVAVASTAFLSPTARRRSPNVSRQSSRDDATAAWAVSATEWAARQATTDVVQDLAAGSAPLPMSHVAIAQRERMQVTPGVIPASLGRCAKPAEAVDEGKGKGKGKGKAKGKSRKRAKGKAKSRKAKRRGKAKPEETYVSPLFSRPATLTKPIWEPKRVEDEL